ncbi:hypothetical protein AB9D95_27140, partial [Klebsiella africana]
MAFDPPLGSTSPAVLLDNATRLDNLLNSLALVYPDREGADLDTWRGIMLRVSNTLDDIRQNLIPLSRQYMTLAAAQADIANIPDGSATYVRSADGSSLADEYINNAGTLEATGRKMPSREAVGEAETKPQFLSRELRSTETFHSSVIRTSNWTNATTSTWAVGSTS